MTEGVFSLDIYRIAKNFGNSSLSDGSGLLTLISDHLEKDRKAQPVFAEGPYHALGKIEEIQKEFSEAVLGNNYIQFEKAVALIALLVRFLNGEHLPGNSEE